MPALARATRLWVGVGWVVLVCMGFSACGGGSQGNAVIARVGNHAIRASEVEGWTHVIERGGAFGGIRGRPEGGTATQRALGVLISSWWLVGEAESHGILLSPALVAEALESRKREEPAYRHRLRASGETTAQARLEMQGEVAAEALRGELISRAAQITPAEVASFYRRNTQRYRTPEERLVDIVTGQPSAAAAAALVRRIGTGARFRRMALRKIVAPGPAIQRTQEVTDVADAMFAAHLGVASQPMRYEGKWAVFVVRKTVPGHLQPLADVRDGVKEAVNVVHQQQLVTKADREYRARWMAQTTCRQDWVAPGCPQYHARLGAYEDPFSTGTRLFLAKQH